MNSFKITLTWVAFFLLALFVFVLIVDNLPLVLIIIVAMLLLSCINAIKTQWKKFRNINSINSNIELIKSGLLLTGVVVVSLLAIELYLRTDITLQSYRERNKSGIFQSPYDEQNKTWLHVYEPNKKWEDHTKEFTRYINANSIGLNDKEYSITKDSASRIISLGDSYTEGVGATSDSSYPKILQSILPHTEVMGCGVAGSDPVFEYKLLQQKLLTYHPDIVTVAINQSDIFDVTVRGGFERFKADGTTQNRQGPWWQWLFADSYIIRLFVIKGMRMDFFFMTPEKKAQEEKKSIEILKTSIDSLQALCNKNNIRCVFIFHPFSTEIKSGEMVCDPLLEYARQQGYETINMLDYFLHNGVNANNTDTYFWFFDGHNKNAGYALFAKAIQDQLSENKLK